MGGDPHPEVDIFRTAQAWIKPIHRIEDLALHQNRAGLNSVLFNKINQLNHAQICPLINRETPIPAGGGLPADQRRIRMCLSHSKLII